MCDFSHWPVLSLLSPQVTSTIKFAVVFGTGNEAVFATVDDKVWVNLEEQNLAEPILIDKLSNLGVIDIRPGFASMFIALTKTGAVHYCGLKNDFPKVPFVAEPTYRIVGLSDKKIRKVACGSGHAVVVTEDGKVFFWGNDGVQNRTNPVKVACTNLHVFIKDIECGSQFTVLLSDNGQLYAFGRNDCGQLGTRNTTDHTCPIKVPGLQNVFVTQLACCKYTSIVLTREGHIYGCGDNLYGQLATGDTAAQLSMIRIAGNLECVYQIAAMNSRHLIAALTKTNHVHIWGNTTVRNFLKPHLTSFNNLDDAFSQFADPPISFRPLTNSKFLYPVYKAFLHYLYTDELDITPESAVGLLELATSSLECELKSKCAEKIKTMISVENAIMFYDASCRCKLNDLEEFCFSFCLKNMSAVTQSEHLKNLREETLKHFVIETSKRGVYKN